MKEECDCMKDYFTIIRTFVIRDSIFVLLIVILTLILIQLNKVIFKYLKRDSHTLHLRFFNKVAHVLIIVMAFIVVLSKFGIISKVYRMLFGSTVVITAVIGLAAQNILQNVFAGITLSMSHPFEIGDRIMIDEVQMPCVVEDMTLRHVVLRTMDGLRYIIPNNNISGMIITNTSYHQRLRGTYISVPISYSSDIRKAITIVRDVITQCPYTFPNNPDNEDINGYGEVYLMSYDDSSLNLKTTIWTEPNMDNFLASSEIRIRILEAFRKNKIEIPYNYTNVIMKNNMDDSHYEKYVAATSRNIKVKTDIIDVYDYHNDITLCFDQVNQYCDFHKINDENRYKIMLLTEELLSFTHQMLKHTTTQFWIEGDKDKITLNLSTKEEFNRNKLISMIKNLSSNNIKNSIFTKLKILLSKDVEPAGWFFEAQDVKGRDIEKQLLLTYSDDIKIGLINNRLTFFVLKNLTDEEQSESPS